MIENLYEQCLIDNSKRGTIKYNVLLGISLALFVVVFAFFVVAIRTDILMLIGAVIFAVPAVIIWRKKDEAYSEFEYCFISGKIDIDQVINNKRRKSLTSFETDELEVFGKVTASNYPRYSSMQNVKKIFAAFDKKDPDLYFAFFTAPKGRVLLVFKPDEELIQNMRKHLKIRIETK